MVLRERAKDTHADIVQLLKRVVKTVEAEHAVSVFSLLLTSAVSDLELVVV
jgi:hypothetical protein